MRLQFIGTGTFGAKDRALTSFLINDELLFDIGSGIIRGLQACDIDISKIKYLIITHYHPDHLFDVVCLLLKRKIMFNNSNKLIIIGPRDIKCVVYEMLEKYLGDNGKNPFANPDDCNLEFVEITNDEFIIGGYKIIAHTVLHGTNEPANGYRIEKTGVRLGFSGDAIECDGLDKIVDNSNLLFLDTTRFAEQDDFHLNYFGALKYAKEYPNKQFFFVHRGDYDAPSDQPDNIIFPNDGDIVEL